MSDLCKYEIVTERINKVLNLLRNGKKIYPLFRRNYVHPNKITIEGVHSDGSEEKATDTFPKLEAASCNNLFTSVRVVCHSSGACSEIEYVYANPQFNSIYAKLKGFKEDVPYPLGLMELFWTDWDEYKPKQEVFIKADVYNCQHCSENHKDLDFRLVDNCFSANCPKENKLIKEYMR